MKAALQTLLCLTVLLFATGCPVTEKSDHDVAKDLPSIAHRAVTNYAHNLASLSRDCADRLERGELKTDLEFNEFYDARQAEILQEAFKPINEHWNDVNRAEKWTAAQTVELLKQEAEGFGRTR